MGSFNFLQKVEQMSICPPIVYVPTSLYWNKH